MELCVVALKSRPNFLTISFNFMNNFRMLRHTIPMLTFPKISDLILILTTLQFVNFWQKSTQIRPTAPMEYMEKYLKIAQLGWHTPFHCYLILYIILVVYLRSGSSVTSFRFSRRVANMKYQIIGLSL